MGRFLPPHTSRLWKSFRALSIELHTAMRIRIKPPSTAEPDIFSPYGEKQLCFSVCRRGANTFRNAFVYPWASSRLFLFPNTLFTPLDF